MVADHSVKGVWLAWHCAELLKGTSVLVRSGRDVEEVRPSRGDVAAGTEPAGWRTALRNNAAVPEARRLLRCRRRGVQTANLPGSPPAVEGQGDVSFTDSVSKLTWRVRLEGGTYYKTSPPPPASCPGLVPGH